MWVRAVVVFFLLLGAALGLTTSAADAYNGGWCLNARAGFAVQEICRFATFEACDRERRLWGTTSFCVQSHYWVPAFEQPRRKIRKRRR